MKEDPYTKSLKVIKKLQEKKISFSQSDNNVLKYLQFLKTKAKNLEAPKPTPFKISTMSAVCKLKLDLDKDKLCKIFECNIKKSIINKEDYPIKTIIYKNINISSISKIKNIKGVFNNQITFVVKVNNNNVNIKYFTNGSISMTGCKSENNGIEAVKIIIKEAIKYPFIFNNEKDLKKSIDDIIYDYKITLINCNYCINFNVDRNNLYKILLKEYNIFASFAPDFYHATKIGFMWNKAIKKYQDGVCECSIDCICKKSKDECKCRLKCVGKDKSIKSTSLGYKDKFCKKITMSVFENGNVIITGSHSIKQTIDTYNHMNNIFKDKYKNIVKYSVNDFQKYIPTDKSNLKIFDYINNDCKDKFTVKKSIIIKNNKIKSKKKSIIIKKNKIKSKKKSIIIKKNKINNKKKSIIKNNKK